MNNPATRIETERLLLEALSLDHADFLYSLLSSAAHTRYLSIPTATNLTVVQQMTEGMLSQTGNCLWLISEREHKSFVGTCGFLNDASVPNFVYSIAEEMQGKGYALEASTAAIEAGRHILGFDQVELNIHAENERSLRIAEKMGFSKVGQYQHAYPQQENPATVYVFRKSYRSI